ncbi:unnamed protein product [Rotaria sp. Silwood1]|nr:unnamed protein product [Rotaria sp. Silwood1]
MFSKSSLYLQDNSIKQYNNNHNSLLVFYNAYLYYNNNMYEQHRSDQRSSTSNYYQEKKRKESDLKLNKSKKKSSKSEFDDARLFCDDCNKFYDNICPYHKQSYIPDKKISKSLIKHSQRLSDLTCPDGIIIKSSTILKAGKGVFATKRFEKNTFFGPYMGTRHSNFKSAQESGYAWSIADKYGKKNNFIDNLIVFYFLQGPNTVEQQNLQPIQYDRNMFYKTMRTIRPGEELFVYYGDDYARFLGIRPFSMNIIQKNIDDNHNINDND